MGEVKNLNVVSLKKRKDEESEKRKAAAIRALERLVDVLKNEDAGLSCFVLTAELRPPEGGRRFMFADGGAGVSPDLYCFMEAVHMQIKEGFVDQFFGDSSDYIEDTTLDEEVDEVPAAVNGPDPDAPAGVQD